MKYEITIKKIEEKEVVKHGDWVVIDERPWTEEEFKDDCHHYQRAEDFLASNPVKEIKGYAPDRKVMNTVETEVLKQTVEDLDMAAVIMAVNNL